MYSGEFKEAISLYENILKKVPKHYQSIQNIGVVYMMQDLPDKALPYFEKSYSLHPTDNLGITNLAYANFKIGNIEKTNEYIKELEKKLDKPILRDLIRMLVALIELKEYDLARRLIDECEYKSSQVVFFSGILYAIKKDYSKAKAIFKELSPMSFIAYKYHNAIIDIEKGRIKEHNFEPVIIESSVDML